LLSSLSKYLNLLKKGLSIKRKVLPVQAKPIVLVLLGFNLPEGNSYPFIFILSQPQRTPGGEPQRPLLVIFLFLHGILRFFRGFNSPKIRDSDYSSGFESSSL
jgi:hypothetical protein